MARRGSRGKAHLSACLDLQGQIVDADVGDLLQQRLALLRVSVDPRLYLDEQLAAAAFDHVAQ